jgi:hypothetical protein
MGSAMPPRSVTTRSNTMTPLEVPSSGGNETSPPGNAEISPGSRTMAVYQPRGSRPSRLTVMSDPAGEVTRTHVPARRRSARRSATLRIST